MSKQIVAVREHVPLSQRMIGAPSFRQDCDSRSDLKQRYTMAPPYGVQNVEFHEVAKRQHPMLGVVQL